MTMIARIPPDPQPTAESQAFWDSARDGRFLVRKCTSCGKAHWYPRTYCPLCASSETQWIEASGNGVIYSYSVMRRAEPPYVMAYVTLDEGPTMMTNLVDCDPERLAIGDAVHVTFVTSEGGLSSPMFSPAKKGDS